MIDVDKLERAGTAAQTGIVALTTEVFAEICSALRSGNAAVRELARERAFGRVSGETTRPVNPPLAQSATGAVW